MYHNRKEYQTVDEIGLIIYTATVQNNHNYLVDVVKLTKQKKLSLWRLTVKTFKPTYRWKRRSRHPLD